MRQTVSVLISPARSRLPARPQALLEAPIVPTLLRLAAPTAGVAVVQATVTTFDLYFVGWLGADALAGVALVFPLVMVMQTMAAGGMGGGVASAIARALGARRRAEANVLVLHALVIAVAMGMLFAAASRLCGRALYAGMGGAAGALEAAVSYSNVVFGGGTAVWLLHTLANVVRGAGDTARPAAVLLVVSALQVSLSPALITGAWGLPSLGVAGAAMATAVSSALGSVFLLVLLVSGRTMITPTFRLTELRAALFGEILRVGAPSALNNVLTNLSVLVLTAVVGSFGTPALAGYGIGVRLEYLQIPLVFGFGSALVTMVGTNIGAGQLRRAEHIAWAGAGIAALITGSIGMLAALHPETWMHFFTAAPEVVASGVTYLRIAGPAYAFLGLGLAFYFASQGAGRLRWPLLAISARLLIAIVGGWIAIHGVGAGLPALFGMIAVSLIAYGAIQATAMAGGAWRRGSRL